MLIFLVYSLATRIIRVSIINSQFKFSLDELKEDFLLRGYFETRWNDDIELYKKEVFWVLFSMGVTACLTVVLIFGVLNSRVFLYIVPLVILIDKWIEYPVYPVLSSYTNYGLAFFSQSSIF